jgi:hypothetical protein
MNMETTRVTTTTEATMMEMETTRVTPTTST